MIKTLKTFYGFVFEKKLTFIAFILLIVFSQILYSLVPYYFKLFIQEISSLDNSRLINLLTFFVIINLAALALDVVGMWIGDKVLFESAKKVRQKIFKHVQDLDFAFHTGKSTGSLISAFKRGDSAFFTLFIILHHRFIEIFVGTSVMLYFFTQIDWKVSILTLISTILTIVATKYLISFNIKKRTIFNKEEDEVSGILTDNLINYETVKLFAKEKWEEKRLKEKFVIWTKALWGYGNSFRAIDIIIGLITNISAFLMLYIALVNTINLKLSIADFVLITSFMTIYFSKIWNLVWSSRDIAKTYADIQTYFGLLDNKIEIEDSKNPLKIDNVKGEISFKHVSFSYKDGKKGALKDFDLKIKKGESIALVGKSGSGKTTMVKLLMRFFDVSKGKITIDNIDIKCLSKSDLRSLMGVVPQEPILFNNSIAYNIGYGKENATLDEIKNAATLANINDFIEKLKDKYDTQVGERGVKLSGGQKQRLAIARMILSNPDIIIFDEATSHLDSESEKLIQDAFWKVREGKTTIIIAHRLSTVAKADRIIVMEEGTIKEIGTHEELLKNKDSLYKHFWDLQINLD